MRKIKPETLSQAEKIPGETKGKKIYPKFRIDLKHLPEAKDKKIGDIYKISLKVKQVGLVMDEYSNEATLEVREIGITGIEKKKTKRYT